MYSICGICLVAVVGLGSTEQLCSKLASDLTHAVVQVTDMYTQVKNARIKIVTPLSTVLL